MDIQKALDTLSGAIITRNKELEALNLAISILQDKFAPEFESRNEAIRQLTEKEQAVLQLTADLTAKEMEIESKEQIINTLTAEKEAAELALETLSAEPTEEPPVEPSEEPTEELATG
jgi:chromosome segregation ATPase